MFALVALPLPLSEPLIYRIPSHLEGKLDLGFRVLVPLRKKIVTGFVVGFAPASGVVHIKEIKDLLDPYPLFSEEMLKLTRWVSEYYVCSWGEALRAAVPSSLMLKSQMWVRRVMGEYVVPTQGLSLRQKKILEILADEKERKLSSLAKALKAKGLYADLYELNKKGIIEIDERMAELGARIKHEKKVRLKNFDGGSGNLELIRTAISTLKKKSTAQSRCLELLLENEGELPFKELTTKYRICTNSLKGLEKKGFIEFIRVEKIRESNWALDLPQTQPLSLNEDQEDVLKKIVEALEKGVYSSFLIFGVTGSGKTQVYIEAIRKVLEEGKEALVLVPEISLTPQIISRFEANFGEKVGCLHSRMSAGERFDTWRRIRGGKLPLVVGARSAVFSPFQNLGLIVVDEEHDPSYKQDDPAPRYNARDVAVMRAKLNNAVVILGSATPSLESYYNARQGKYILCQLKERVQKQTLPQVRIVDLLQERKKGNRRFLSTNLRTLLQDRMEKKEQALLFLNRRGFSTLVKCQDCGYVEKCPRCDITLTFHRIDFSLRCHYCNYQKKAFGLCPNCQGYRFTYKGVGTQKVIQELEEIFPQAQMERMDLDTTAKKGSHQRLLSDFGKKKFGILVGTQMIAKGLDFPDVTLVGVVFADFSLDLPDFRSKERTFQLLAQVAGRAGRGQQKGEVIIQTYYPQEWAIQLAASHDFEGFFKKELEQRRELGYPPFNHLILVVFSGRSLRMVKISARNFSTKLRRMLKMGKLQVEEVLGPAPAPLSKIKNLYRWQVLIKTKSAIKTGSLIKKILEEKKRKKKTEPVRITVNVDPMDML